MAGVVGGALFAVSARALVGALVTNEQKAGHRPKIPTSDAGAHWSHYELPTLPASMVGLSFVDADHGWVVGSTGAQYRNGTLLETEDAGATWRTVRLRW